MKILLVDDTKTDRLIMTQYLEKLGHEVITGENGKQATELFQQANPDLVLMDVVMPEMDGYQAAQLIRVEASEWVPIIFLSARVEPEDIQAGIDAGGDDYLTKPVNHVILAAKMKAMERIAKMRRRLVKLSVELEKANHELTQLANIDGLTGLANRRYMDNYLRVEISRAVRNQQSLTIVLADVDSFKPFNDNYGHLEGDDCLKKVASSLDTVCQRSTDLVARYGGEEFAIILPDTTTENAALMAEKMRMAIETLSIPHAHSKVSDICTMSFGVYSGIPERGSRGEQLLALADAALYKAKENGRNQVQFNQPVDSA